MQVFELENENHRVLNGRAKKENRKLRNLSKFTLYALLGAAVSIMVSLDTATGKPDERSPLVVYAASSLQNAMIKMGNQFEKTKSVRISYVYGSSGSLARKIELGAPSDVFLSASKRWGAYLEGKKIILPESRRALAGNSLVCVVPLSSPIRFSRPADLSHAVKISLGDPAHVPAGIYAHESLAKLKLWRNLSEKGKLIFSPNVRAALILVEREQVSAGIVYKSDAMFSKHTRIAFEFPSDTYTPITYDGSVVSASRKKETAAAFLEFMMSNFGASVLHRWGFSPRGN